MTQKKYFELIEGSSAKFWEISLEGTKVLIRFGRIGANGQCSEKQEETESKSHDLYLKLIAEKTKKGYQEVQQMGQTLIEAFSTDGIMALWKQIVAGDNNALRQYLSLLGPNQEDQMVIAKIIKRFRKADIADASLIVSLVPLYDGEEDEDNVTEITFSKPYEGPLIEELPASVMEACKIANGVSFESAGGGYLGFMGIDDGCFVGSGGWDSGLFEEDEIEGLWGAMDYGQNWICFNDKQTNKLGEPQLFFVSHEGGEPKAIKKANALSFGQVTLRVISQYFTEGEELDQVYN